jgi:hypothetical protein
VDLDAPVGEEAPCGEAHGHAARGALDMSRMGEGEVGGLAREARWQTRAARPATG